MSTSSQSTFVVALCLTLLKLSWKAFWTTCAAFISVTSSLLILFAIGSEPSSGETVMVAITEGLGSLIGGLTLTIFVLLIALWSLGAIDRRS